ncbi:MAG: hypothetical protein QG628_882 [Patescibacteria group bacterium]|nr:hypothetical protein [Patescibacteria group bacterium]
MKNLKTQKQQTIDKNVRGYSDYRLQPMYLLFTALFFLAWPLFGQFAAFLLVSVPAFMIALKVSQLQAREAVATAEYIQGINDLYYSLEVRDYNFEHAPTPAQAPKIKKISKKSVRPAFTTMRTVLAK